MLETIREFGLERLDVGRETEKMQRRHAEFYARLAEEAEPAFLRMLPAQATWLLRLEAEHANLRAALDLAPRRRRSRSGFAAGGRHLVVLAHARPPK